MEEICLCYAHLKNPTSVLRCLGHGVGCPCTQLNDSETQRSSEEQWSKNLN